MAGRRRRDGVTKPMVRTLRAERRQANLNAKLAACETPLDRIAAAADYLRGALAVYPDPAVTLRAVEFLVGEADEVYRKAGNRR